MKPTGKAEETVDTAGLSKDEALLKIALDRFKQVQTATNAMRTEALEDVGFYGGKHWVEQILRDRTEDRRPALTINKVPSFCHRVINDIRQNAPSIKIRPVDSVSDPATAEVIDGLIRHIISNGNSQAAIDNASFYQVVCGFGFFRVTTDYMSDTSFDQEIKISRIENPFSVYFPIHLITEADYSDAPYAFIRTKISKDEFKAKYPKSKTVSFEMNAIGDLNWVGEDYIYLAEYFYIEETKTTLYKLSDGSTTIDKATIAEGLQIVQERPTLERKVKWCLINEFEILDRKDWPCKFIPIIPVLGQEIPSVDDSGRKSYISLVRFMKDPQRMYNYWMTAYTEKVANSPKAPYLVAAGQCEQFPEWKDLNRKNIAYLRYKPIDVNGVMVPMPSRTQAAEVESAIFQGVQIASQEMKEVTGIYDASLGSMGQESSGRAIIARQKQGDISNYHFIGNQAQSYHLLGRILIDLVPEIYDTPRSIRILGEDMTDKIAEVNAMHPTENGKPYDLSVGEYDVVVDIGPSYETKRMEAAETLSNVLPQMPLVGQVAPDLIMRMLDNPLSSEVADRLKRFIQAQPNMQGVIAQEEEGNSQQMNAEQMQAIVQDLHKVTQAHQMTMQQNQQMQGMIQNLQKALKDKQDAIAAKMHDTEVRAKTQIATAQIDLQKEHIKQAPVVARTIVDNALSLHQAGTPEIINTTNPPAGSAEIDSEGLDNE